MVAGDWSCIGVVPKSCCIGVTSVFWNRLARLTGVPANAKSLPPGGRTDDGASTPVAETCCCK